MELERYFQRGRQIGRAAIKRIKKIKETQNTRGDRTKRKEREKLNAC